MLAARRSVVAAGNSSQSGTGWGAGGVDTAGSFPLSLNLTRFDGLSSLVVVSGGVPLKKGALLASELSTVALTVSGSEVQCYVEALGRNYADGSVRSLLVQTSTSGATLSKTAVLSKGVTPLSRLSKVTPPYRPDAMWLQSSPADACAAKGVFGMISPSSGWDVASDSNVSYWLNEYTTYEGVKEYGLTSWQRAPAYYEPSSTMIAMWAATGTAAYVNHALLCAYRIYFTYYSQGDGLAHTGWDANEPLNSPLMLAHCYLMTGAPEFADAVENAAGLAVEQGGTEGSDLGGPISDSLRQKIRHIHAMLGAWMCGYTYVEWFANPTVKNAVPATWLTDKIGRLQTTQLADGLWGPALGAAKLYWNAMVCSALAFCYDVFEVRSDTVTKIGTNLDAVWSYADGTGIPYTTDGNTANWDDGSSGKGWELTPMFLYAMLWYGERIGGATRTTWRSRASDVLLNRKTNTYYRNAGGGVMDKEFDEIFWFFPQAIGARDGVASTGAI